MKTKWHEKRMENYLAARLNRGLESGKLLVVQTFQEGGVLTNNKGLVVETSDGAQFQITIVQSRR